MQIAKGLGDNGIWRIAKLNGIPYLPDVGSKTTSFSSAFAVCSRTNPRIGGDLYAVESRLHFALKKSVKLEHDLADLHDPDLMLPNLHRVHLALDRAVDRLYRAKGFTSERERVEHLFMLYEKMRAPLATRMKDKPRRGRTRRMLPSRRTR